MGPMLKISILLIRNAVLRAENKFLRVWTKILKWG